MRGLAFILCLIAAAPALAQQSSEITLDGRAGPPVIEVRINDRPVRLAVDPRMPDALALDADAAARARVRNLPLVRAQLLLDDASLLARLARPEIEFANGEEQRVIAVVFSSELVAGADGMIGPGALPYERVTIDFAAPREEGRAHVFALQNADLWSPRVALAPEITTRVDFNISYGESVLNPPAVSALQRAGLISSAGELTRTPLVFGLSAMTQLASVDPAVTVDGLALGRTLARTNAPILGPEDEDAVIVEPSENENAEPRVSLGLDALSRCWSISVERRSRQLTLRCAD